MINIHKVHYIIKGNNRKVEDSEFLLAYMTHVELDKEGNPAQNFTSRKATGLSWATHRGYSKDKSWKQEDNEIEFNNEPMEGFKIIGSTSRWSTSNKLIYVEDPRGFVVEIPTANLTTLLKHSVCDHGEIKEKCVWGKEGNNHILLSVNSDVYRESVEKIQQQNNSVPFNKLKTGDIIKFHVDDSDDYVYLGKGRLAWDVKIRKATEQVGRTWFKSYRPNPETDEVLSSSERLDNKTNYLFMCTNPKASDYYKFEYKSTGKAILVGYDDNLDVDSVIEEFIKLDRVDVPDRILSEHERDINKGNHGYYSKHQYLTGNMVSFKKMS